MGQAEASPDLTPVATSGSWRVYLVEGAELVEPLPAEPAVLEGVPEGGKGWLEPAVDWYLDSSEQDVFLAAEGPPSWQRVTVGERPATRPVPDARVTDIETGVDHISFRVDRPGVPVLVKASYFPNWKAEGADGPWRVAPNLMVVMPTATEVELRYGTTPVEWLAWALTVLGAGGLVVLARRGPVPVAARRPEAGADGDGGTPAQTGAPADDRAESERTAVFVAAGRDGPPEGGEVEPASGSEDGPGPRAGGGPVVQPSSPPAGRIWGPSGRDADPAG